MKYKKYSVKRNKFRTQCVDYRWFIVSDCTRVIWIGASNVKAATDRSTEKWYTVLCCGHHMLNFSILFLSPTSIKTRQSHVTPSTENISHFVFVFTSVNFINDLEMLSFYLNTFQTPLVTRLESLKPHNISTLILKEFILTPETFCSQPVIHAPRIENQCLRRWEVCYTVWQQ